MFGFCSTTHYSISSCLWKNFIEIPENSYHARNGWKGDLILQFMEQFCVASTFILIFLPTTPILLDNYNLLMSIRESAIHIGNKAYTWLRKVSIATEKNTLRLSVDFWLINSFWRIETTFKFVLHSSIWLNALLKNFQ